MHEILQAKKSVEERNNESSLEQIVKTKKVDKNTPMTPLSKKERQSLESSDADSVEDSDSSSDDSDSDSSDSESSGSEEESSEEESNYGSEEYDSSADSDEKY